MSQYASTTTPRPFYQTVDGWWIAVQDWQVSRREILSRGTTAVELREALIALGPKPVLVPR